MGVYIPGMEMPTICRECHFDVAGWCYATDRIDNRTSFVTDYPIQPWCPLVPVPEHGDLIDRDSTIEKIRHLSDEIDKKLGYEKSAPYITMALYLSNADDFPTIIPASEEGET